MSSAPAVTRVDPLPATVRVAPWDDPVVDRRGHDPRSAYVEQFWLSVLGPTATWLLRRLVVRLRSRAATATSSTSPARPARSG